jgi:hypothetical protein
MPEQDKNIILQAEIAYHSHPYATCPYCGDEEEVSESKNESECSFCHNTYEYSLSSGFANFRCNKCNDIVVRDLGRKHWTPSFCEKTGLNARLYRISEIWNVSKD